MPVVTPFLSPALCLALLTGVAVAQEPVEEAADAELVEEAAGAADAAEDPTSEPRRRRRVPAQRGVAMVYTGGLGGPGAGQYPMHIVRDLRAAEEAGAAEITALRTVHGAAAQGPVLMVSEDGLADTIVRALRSGGIRCGDGTPAPARATATETLLLDEPGPHPVLDALGERGLDAPAWVQHACTNDDGYRVRVLRPADAPVPGDLDPDIARWELRRAVLGTLGGDGGVEPGPGARGFTILPSPVQESSRLLARALALKAEEPGALFVDAGSFLAGVSSVRNDALSLHRETSWRMLEALEPAALVPGETELVKGAASFLAERAGRVDEAGALLPYLATNWTAPPELELPDHLRVRVPQESGEDVVIAFVGVLDPALHATITELRDEGVEIGDPVAEVQAVVDRLQASETPPDTVVALTTARGEVLAELRRRLRGVELVVGDPTMATLRVTAQHVALRDLPPQQKAAPVTLSMDGLATAALELDDERLRGVTSVPRLVRGELPVHAETTAAMTEVRVATYPALDVPLVPARDPADPLSTWTEEAWFEVVCEAVRAATDADSVMLRPVPFPQDIPGPLTELLVVDQLDMLDQLVLHRVPGDKLGGVLDKAWGTDVVTCGARPGSPTAWGRGLEGGRTYRVVTTDRTMAATPVGEILDGVPASGLLDPQGVEVLRGPKDNELTVRMAVLQALRAVREEAGEDRDRPDLDRMEVFEGDAAVRTFLAEAPGKKPPQWLLRLRGLAVSVDRFRGTDEPAFAEVPETLATSASSLTVTGDADLALEHDARALTWDLRYRQSYATVATGEEDPTETADDLRLSTSLEAPSAAFDAGLTWSPFAEFLYDTEISATLDDTGAKNALQSDLSLTLGLSAAPEGPLDTLRLGAFANRDMSRLSEKPTEWGGRGEVLTGLSVGFATWKLGTSGSVWADTAQDDASDLRFDLRAETSLGLPLARWLSLQTYARAYVLQGRVPENDVLGAAWTLGARLDASGILEL